MVLECPENPVVVTGLSTFIIVDDEDDDEDFPEVFLVFIAAIVSELLLAQEIVLF